jgi:uncharacterized RDD family membrane protein YckC
METPPPPERPEPDLPPSPGEPPPPPTGPQAPAYGGPVPPGGWQQPLAQGAPAWHGRPLASWGSRVAAQLLDWLILLIPVAALTGVVVAIASNSDVGAWVTGVLGFFAYIVVICLYAPLLMAREGAHNGQSWGKQIIGIRVIRDQGGTMSFGLSAIREIVVKNLAVGIASMVIPLIPWFLDNFWPLWDDENRALHDMAVSTHVVRG